MSHDPKTILLAGPSLLYAPVFLAKYGRLSPVFDHVQLDWEPERREAAWQNSSAYRDPLLAALLEKNRDDEVVIAVCDPCRVGYLPKVGGCHIPCLLSGLIKRACLNYGTLGREEFGDDDDIFTKAGEIIVNKPGMTSFSITAELLGHMGAAPDLPDLFHGVPIGLERTEAVARTLIRKHASSPTANCSTDREVLFSSLSSPDSTASGQNRSVCDLELSGDAAAAIKRYKTFLFTGLLTTDEFRSTAPHFLREVISAISFAIRVIEADPRAAARELWRARDLRRALERDVNFDQAVVFLKRMATDKVFECCVEPAFDHDHAYLEPLGNAVETHKAAKWATDVLVNNQRSSFNPDKVWDLLPSRRSSLVNDSQSLDPAASSLPKPTIFAKLWSCLRPIPPRDSEQAFPKEDTLLSASNLLKVPPGARQSFTIGLLMLFVMSALFLFILGLSERALVYATPTIADWEKAPGWQRVLYVFDPFLENDPVKEEEHVRHQIGLVFSLIGCVLLAFLERPRRRNTRGYGPFDWLFFLGGMGVVLIGVRAMSDGKTMVNTLFGWGAIFYAFARLARHPLPNPLKWWRASRQRRIGIYEFRRALRQSAWESKETAFACEEAQHPSRTEKVKMRARMRWHQTGWLLSLVLGGEWSGWLAGLRVRIILAFVALALFTCHIRKPDWLPLPPWAMWLGLLLFVAIYLFLRWLTTATPMTWGGMLQKLWDWLRWQCYRPLWGGSGFRNADQIE